MLSPTALDSELALDALQPVQFDVIWRGTAQTAPERRLLVAMIEQAAADVRLFRHRRSARARRMFADARDWLLSNDRSHPMAFATICDLLGLEPGTLRAVLLSEYGPHRADHWESAA